MSGFLVTERIDGTIPSLPNYPLLPGDLLVRDHDGSWWKEAPGLAVGGFILTDAQVATLEPTGFVRNGLEYALVPLATSGRAVDATAEEGR